MGFFSHGNFTQPRDFSTVFLVRVMVGVGVLVWVRVGVGVGLGLDGVGG